MSTVSARAGQLAQAAAIAAFVAAGAAAAAERPELPSHRTRAGRPLLRRRRQRLPSHRNASACGRKQEQVWPSCQCVRPYVRPMAHTDGVACEWVAAARATPSGDHALVASPARCNWSPSIFAEVGRALAAARRGATDRPPLPTTPGARTRCLLGVVKSVPWCFPVAGHAVGRRARVRDRTLGHGPAQMGWCASGSPSPGPRPPGTTRSPPSPARCNRSPSIFAEVGRVLAAARRGTTDRPPLPTNPGAHTRCLLGVVVSVPWCFPVAGHAVGRRAQIARPYVRPMAHTDGVVCEWVAAARATPSGDHALAASPARCNWSPSIFAEVGRALAAARRGATDRPPLPTTPGARTRCLLGLVKFVPWCFPVAGHAVSY